MNDRTLQRAPAAALVLTVGLLVAFVAFALPPQALAKGPSASKLYKMGERAEARSDVEAAYADYAQAYQKKPEDLRYKIAYERTRSTAASLHVERGERLRSQGNITGALTEFLRALQIDPSNELAAQEIRATRQAQLNKPGQPLTQSQVTPVAPMLAREMGHIGGPIHLKPLSNEPLTLHMVENSKVVYQTVAKAAGINVLFDPSYSSKRIQVDLQNTDLYDALRIIGLVSGTFWQPVTPNTIFVAEDTRTKRMELQQQAVQTFYLTNVSQQNDFTDIETALRNLFQTAKIYGVASQNAIIMRGTPDELLLAQKIIDDLDKPKPEVVLQVAVLEVSKNFERTLGIQLPQTAGVALQSSNANTSTSSTPSTSTPATSTPTTSGLTLNSLAHLNATNFAVTIGQAQANLLLTNSTTKILQDPRIRVLDGQQATLKIGERIPVATGSYQTGAATAIVSSLVNTQFQYLDVGVNIKVTPIIHYDQDVTLKLDIGVSSEAGTTNLGGINEPIIAQHTISQTVRLKNGEANILGGILQRQTSNSLSGTPGLAKLPILKYIFGSNDKTEQNEQIVFLLIPHVVRTEMLDPLNLREIDTGTANDIELRHLNYTQPAPQQQEAPAPPAQQAVPSPAVNPAPATPPAAANALAQLRSASTSPVSLTLAPELQQQKVGSTFQILVNLTGATNAFSVPMRLQYDSTKLSLINVDLGDSGPGHMDFLGKDGQPVALVHRDEGNGNVEIAASRPPGASGVSGSGTICVLTFKATAAGPAAVVITQGMVRNSAQQAIPATGGRAIVRIQP